MKTRYSLLFTLFCFFFFSHNALGAECLLLPKGIIPDEGSTEWELKKVERLKLFNEEHGQIRFYANWMTDMQFTVYTYFGKKVLKTWACQDKNQKMQISPDHTLAVNHPEGWQITGEPIVIEGTETHTSMKSVTLLLGPTKIVIYPRKSR